MGLGQRNERPGIGGSDLQYRGAGQRQGNDEDHNNAASGIAWAMFGNGNAAHKAAMQISARNGRGLMPLGLLLGY